MSTLVTAVGNMYLNHRRNQMVKDAILQGGPQVDSILARVKDDMNNIFALQVSTGASEQLATLVRAYNKDRAQLSYEQRVARLAEVKAAVESGTAAAVSAPAQLVSAMLTANDALLEAAKQKHGNFADLNAALNTWSSEIETLAGEIQPLVK